MSRQVLVAEARCHIGDTYYAPGSTLPDDFDGRDEFLRYGSARLVDESEAPNVPPGDLTRVLTKVLLEKYEGEDADARASDPGAHPDDTYESEDNLLMIGGASAFWQRLIGTGVTAFDAANAFLAVGDSTTAAADTQTDLQAATNKLRKAMDATYPQHTDSTSLTAAKSITYRSTFATGDANFAWQEWGLFNASTAGRMLDRKVENLGTKTSAASWTLTITLTLA